MKNFLFFLVTLIFISSNAFSQFQKDIIVTSPDGIWTDSRAYTTLNAAVTAVGLVPRKIVIASPQTVSTLTVPSNVTLQFERNGSITNTGQLTLQTKNILAEDRQIFTGAGDVDFAIGTIVRSSWFSTFSSAILITSDDSVTLVISKQESVSSNITLGNNVYLKWESPENRLTVNVGFTFSNIGNVDAGDYQIFAGAGDFDFKSGTELNIRWFEHLRAALTWIETERVTIYISGTNQVDFTDAVQSNIILDFTRRNGQLSISAGIVLTINGGISSASTHIFTGLGTVVFGNSLVTTVDPFWFGILGNGTNDAVAFQSAITAASGRCLITPAGTYRIDAGLTYNTSGTVPGLCIQGAGMNKTLFDNRVANGALFSLDGSGTTSFAFGGRLSDFSIITTTNPVSSRGIDIHSQFYLTVERVRIQGLSSHAIKIISNDIDADSSAYCTFKQLNILLNGGWGVIVDSTVAISALHYPTTALIDFIECEIAQNTLGGVSAMLAQQWRFQSCSISTNGGTGIHIPYTAGIGSAQNITVENCEFDGNVGYDVDFQSLAHGRVVNSKFIMRAVSGTSIRFGDGGSGSAVNCLASKNIFRRDAGTVTGIAFGTNSSYCRAENNFFPILTGVTPYTDTGTLNTLQYEGNEIARRLTTRAETIATAYTPDLAQASVHRISASSTGTFTVNNPIYTNGLIQTGQELELILLNSSGGVTRFTFGAAYKMTSKFLSPLGTGAGPFQTSATFIYSQSGLWEQMTTWSLNSITVRTSTTGSFTPDVSLATTHYLFITATGAFAINAPIKSSGAIINGETFDLIILNFSGGAIAVTFPPTLVQGGYLNPVNGYRTSTRFVYESVADGWYQVGSWSAPF